MRRRVIVQTLGLLLTLATVSLSVSLSMSLSACHGDDECAVLFGTPTEATGLGADRCRPSCACGGSAFVPPTYDAAFFQSLIDDWQLATPFAALTVDPYTQPVPPDDPAGTVCAVLPTGDPTSHPRSYDLVTYPSLDAARGAGAHPTHYGHCGVCSTLANLAVYMREADLGGLVRQCGLNAQTDVACLMGLGFDLPCAQIWAYNTTNTRNLCLEPCVASFNAPYNLPDGTLNACLACDEQQSGPVFKAVAGRTRRNSGLPNAICRPCNEVQPLVHDYPPSS